jgi:hypothetical protein
LEEAISSETRDWDGWTLKPDGTILFAAVVDYGLLAVPTGVILQFLHAYSQEEMTAAICATSSFT